MNKTVCEINKCVGCKSCLDVCIKSALSFSDTISSMNVFIDSNKCIECGACQSICQVNSPVQFSKPFYWKQGWAEHGIREKSSSGGFATQLMKSFVNENSYVCSCAFKGGKFNYYYTNDKEDVDSFRGSKYVKSDPEGIYKKVQNLLIAGKRVLFIGLPCHVAAVKKYLHGRYEDSLFTVDLICHGSPSPELFKSFLAEHRYNINSIDDVHFRIKNRFGVILGGKSIVPFGSLDRYSIGFLNGLFYTENCYSCNYAKLDRVSDITIGDSWGTELQEEEHGGISIALCQTQKGKELLSNSKLNLIDVDIDIAVKANHQLQYPSIILPERSTFFEAYAKTGSVEKSVFCCFPKECLKQGLKGILIRLHIINGGDRKKVVP